MRRENPDGICWGCCLWQWAGYLLIQGVLQLSAMNGLLEVCEAAWIGVIGG